MLAILICKKEVTKTPYGDENSLCADHVCSTREIHITRDWHVRSNQIVTIWLAAEARRRPYDELRQRSTGQPRRPVSMDVIRQMFEKETVRRKNKQTSTSNGHKFNLAGFKYPHRFFGRTILLFVPLAMAPTPTVSFNVGGTVYEVSKSLLKQHPNTLMSRMASDEWQQEQSGGPSAKKQKTSQKDECLPKAMFIDRDGTQFKYVLQYMRDHKVTIPYSSEISKTAVLDDLFYYGVTGIDETLVEIENPSIINCGKFLKQKKNESYEMMKHIFYETIAQKCCERDLENNLMGPHYATSVDEPLSIDVDHQMVLDVRRYIKDIFDDIGDYGYKRAFDTDELEKHLATYGMKLRHDVEVTY